MLNYFHLDALHAFQLRVKMTALKLNSGGPVVGLNWKRSVQQGTLLVYLKALQNLQSFGGWGRCGAEDAQCRHCGGLPVSAAREASGLAP